MNLEKLKQKQMKLKRGGKKIMKIGMKRERGITLIALVVTIVVLLILAGVSINALFGNSGIIEKAKEAQNKMDKATENDQKEIKFELRVINHSETTLEKYAIIRYDLNCKTSSQNSTSFIYKYQLKSKHVFITKTL